jgi:ATP-dependent protease HslVU (ClpYQ) peptidase subunit
MTVVIAYVDGNVVLVACDSAATTDSSITVRRGAAKIWSMDDFIVGFCGDFGFGQFLRYAFEWEQPYEPYEKWLVVTQKKLKKAIVKRFEKNDDWQLIVAIKGRVFVLSPCGDVEETVKNFSVIGSGADTARGAMESMNMHNPDMMSWEKIDSAMAVAADYHCDVRLPVHYLYTMKHHSNECE